MIKHEVLELTEQKYAGIKTVIGFKEADQINFSKLHEDVLKAGIRNIDHQEHFMAMDTDFTEESFSYTPLVPVTSFGRNEGFTTFTRAQGTYYAFEVTARELNPGWFKSVFEYIKENDISIENTGYDLEYYEENCQAMIDSLSGYADRVLRVVFKMKC